MKKCFLSFSGILLAGFLFIGCDNNANDKVVDEDTIATTAPVVENTKKTNDFVTEAATGGLMEVALGKLAQTNAASQAVKDFGKMMETDHSAANAELTQVANAENIDLPTDMTASQIEHVAEMGKMNGADFDKAYMSMMVDDHNKDIDTFKKAADENDNAAVKAFAAKTLPVLQKHQDEAKKTKSKLK